MNCFVGMLITLFKVRTINLTELASGFAGQAMYLSMDRTNWLWGKSNINILILSIVYKGIAIPLFWNLLPKRGNSDTAERIEIISRFIEQFGKSKIAALLADREFVGNDWFDWLLKEGVFFCIRIKNNVITTNAHGLEVSIDTLFYDLKPGEQRILLNKRKLWKQKVYLSALRLPDGKLLIVAMQKFMENPIELYSKR